MAHRQLILAVFPDEGAADTAAAALKDSDIAHRDAIGVLALDADGKLKQDKVGKRSTGKGAAIGGVIAVFSTAVLGPAVLVGAAAGALHHKNLGLSDADKARLTLELNAGKAAVGVMSKPRNRVRDLRVPDAAGWRTRESRAHRQGRSRPRRRRTRRQSDQQTVSARFRVGGRGRLRFSKRRSASGERRNRMRDQPRPRARRGLT